MLKKKSVLIVDDHVLFAKGFADCLQSTSYASYIDYCTSYEEMKIKLSHEVPDVLFLDIYVGGKDGFTICEELLKVYKRLQIVIVSNYASDTFVKRAKELGAQGYISKTASPEIFKNYMYSISSGDIKGFFSYLPTDAAIAVNGHLVLPL